MTDLRVGGVAPFSSCDWPGNLVATIFCQGCPWDCPYCHNPHLLPAIGARMVAWTDILAFLERRRGLLEGVVFSGGEPTLQAALPDAIQAVRDMGFRIGLHTAGSFPERLAALLPSVDWVGLDIKAPFDDYERITGIPDSGSKAKASLAHLIKMGIDCEIRTTVHPALIEENALRRLIIELQALGVTKYALQNFREQGVTSPIPRSPTPLDLDGIRDDYRQGFADFCVR